MKKIIVAMLLSTLMLSGCGLFHSDKSWKKAQQESPLEIPPQLDRPNVSEALAIPTVNADHEEEATASSRGTLHLNTDVDSAYKRVGLALGNGDIGSIVSQSDTGHTYQVAMASKIQIGSSQGFLQRHFSNTQNPAGEDSSSGSSSGQPVANVTVQVMPAAGGGSEVRASGDPQQVAKLMNVLKSRLGG